MGIWRGSLEINRTSSRTAARDLQSLVKKGLLKQKGIKKGAYYEVSMINIFWFRDQVIFEEGEVLKPDNKPYTIFAPYKNKWLIKLSENISHISPEGSGKHDNYFKCSFTFPSLQETGSRKSCIIVRPYDLSVIPDYQKYRNLPAIDKTSYLSPHLRFGTVSIRYLVYLALKQNMSFLNELIWREFFMQILFHFPGVVTDSGLWLSTNPELKET